MNNINEIKELFTSVEFPIMLVDGQSLQWVDLEEFLIDPDINFWKRKSTEFFIDSGGFKWSWSFNDSLNCIVPGTRIGEVSIKSIKFDIIQYAEKFPKIKEDILQAIDLNKSIKSLFTDLSQWA